MREPQGGAIAGSVADSGPGSVADSGSGSVADSGPGSGPGKTDAAAPLGPTGRAHRDIRTGLALRAVFALVAAAGLVVAGIVIAAHGVTPHLLPTSNPASAPVTVRAYSGPMWAIAIGLGAVAGLLVVSAIADIVRRRLIGPTLAATTDHDPNPDRREPGTLDG